MRDNGRLFYSRIAAMSDIARKNLAQFILTRCFLVVVSTPDLDSAYRVFSVMNSRGLNLSATDILKAEIIGAIIEGLRETYTNKWENAEEDLGREAFGDLFSHIRMIYRKAKPQGTLLKEFQVHVSESADPCELIDDVILPMSTIYAELTDAVYKGTSFSNEINRSLRWLNRIEFSDWLPPALAFSKANRNHPLHMRDFFVDLERLCYSLLIRKAGVNERIERFSKLTSEIEGRQNLADDKSLLQLTAFEKVQVFELLNGPIYESLSARARSSILLRIDDLLSGGGATYDYSSVTVEHVLPQSPDASSKWLVWFPEEQSRLNWVHRLGNLALLTRNKNSSARNFEFEKKKTAYFSNGGVSPFQLTTQVLQYESWTEDIVEKRQTALMKLLTDHWRLA